jgi:hypothetical protein
LAIGAALGGTLPETSRTRWIAEHRDGLMLALAGVAVAILFFVDLSGIGFLVLAAILIVLELALARIGRKEPAEAT